MAVLVFEGFSGCAWREPTSAQLTSLSHTHKQTDRQAQREMYRASGSRYFLKASSPIDLARRVSSATSLSQAREESRDVSVCREENCFIKSTYLFAAKLELDWTMWVCSGDIPFRSGNRGSAAPIVKFYSNTVRVLLPRSLLGYQTERFVAASG